MSSTSAQTRSGRRNLLDGLRRGIAKFPSQAKLCQAVDVALEKIDGGAPPSWLVAQSGGELERWRVRLEANRAVSSDPELRTILASRADVVGWAIKELDR